MTRQNIAESVLRAAERPPITARQVCHFGVSKVRGPGSGVSINRNLIKGDPILENTRLSAALAGMAFSKQAVHWSRLTS